MSASLSSSVSSLQSSLSLLGSSISTLDAGVCDFPRLRRVLSSTTHFELLPEPTLRAAQQALHDEIGPSITQLINVAAQYIEKLGRREESLRARSELMEGRLSGGGGGGRRSRGSSFGQLGAGARPTLKKGGSGGNDAGNAARAAELKKLRQRKERLQYAVDRLELQGKQRERELRKSMAMPP